MEERALSGQLSLTEIHVIEAVFKAKAKGENNFSSVAKLLNVTLGTLNKSYNKLESKGYLKKQQDKRDKRIYYIIPTELAERANEQHTLFHAKMVGSISERLNKKSLNNLADSLEALSEFFLN